MWSRQSQCWSLVLSLVLLCCCHTPVCTSVAHFGKASPLTKLCNTIIISWEMDLQFSDTATVKLCWFGLYRLESQPGTLNVVPIITVITLYPINKLVFVVRVKTVHRSTSVVHEIIFVTRIIASGRFPHSSLIG